jgi:hypothetical protein
VFCTILRLELATVYLYRGTINANSHMNAWQEHINPYPPFQPAPMPQNAKDAHALLAIVIVTWVLGFVLLLWIDRRKKK